MTQTHRLGYWRWFLWPTAMLSGAIGALSLPLMIVVIIIFGGDPQGIGAVLSGIAMIGAMIGACALVYIGWAIWYRGWAVVRDRYPDRLVLVTMRASGTGEALVPFGWTFKEKVSFLKETVEARRPGPPDYDDAVHEFHNRQTIVVDEAGIRIHVGWRGVEAAFIPRASITDVAVGENQVWAMWRRLISVSVVTPDGARSKVQLCPLKGMASWASKRRVERDIAAVRAALGFPSET